MSDGNGGDGDNPGPYAADVVTLADVFATHCQLEHQGEYVRLIFSSEVTGEVVPSARIVLTPSGLMELAEAVLAFYVRRP
jgi:hypothetical protein